jgi:hypothetical protein
MKTIERASPILSAPRSRLDASRPDAPERGELRAFVRALVEAPRRVLKRKLKRRPL